MSEFYVKPGDIIGFSGRSLRSDFINLATGGIPRWSNSHVGIIGASNCQMYMFDSVEKARTCGISFNFHRGVQAHHLKDVLADYRGRVWHYSLYRRLYPHESKRLTTFLEGSLGNGYDKAGAIRSSGFLFALLNSLIYGQDLNEKFCSEYAAAAEARIGIFHTVNASRWSPNKLVRAMRRAGLLHRRKRLK